MRLIGTRLAIRRRTFDVDILDCAKSLLLTVALWPYGLELLRAKEPGVYLSKDARLGALRSGAGRAGSTRHAPRPG